MKATIGMSAFCLCFFFVTHTWADDDEIVPGRIRSYQLAKPDEIAKKLDLFGEIGDVFQVYMIRRIKDKKEQTIKTFKVQTTGDAVSFIAVLELPVMLSGTTSEQRHVDNDRQNMSCFLKSVKLGESVVKITPIGLDGKEQETKEITLKVVSASKDRKERNRPTWSPLP
jgi:hypothetical protein